MHKKQWLVLDVGLALAVGLFFALSSSHYVPSKFVTYHTVNPDKSVTIVRTMTNWQFNINPTGYAILGFLVISGGTIFAVKKTGRSLPREKERVFAHAEADPGVWPPPPEAP